jgi:hydroxyacylglutathione hydrolase
VTVQVETFPVPPLGCNCSILYSEASQSAIVIDPGGMEKEILEKLKKRNFKLTHILHTHAHFDHCLGTSELASHHESASVCLHRDDLFLYEKLEMQCRAFGIFYSSGPIREISHFLEDEEEFYFEKKSGIKVIFTPGHTPGSTCFYLNMEDKKILFSGDTLFSGSIGRTDLWGGDSTKIIKSIENRLFTLEDETLVIPGHGEFTKIYREKRTNPFFV